MIFSRFLLLMTTSFSGGGACSGKQGRRSKRLGLDNMAGIFLVRVNFMIMLDCLLCTAVQSTYLDSLLMRKIF